MNRHSVNKFHHSPRFYLKYSRICRFLFIKEKIKTSKFENLTSYFYNIILIELINRQKTYKLTLLVVLSHLLRQS